MIGLLLFGVFAGVIVIVIITITIIIIIISIIVITTIIIGSVGFVVGLIAVSADRKRRSPFKNLQPGEQGEEGKFSVWCTCINNSIIQYNIV